MTLAFITGAGGFIGRHLAQHLGRSGTRVAGLDLISAGDGLLDSGACGWRTGPSFAPAKDGFSATALEPDRSDIVDGGAIHALVTQAGLPIQVEQNISERLPFADASFDIVYARAVLHHIADLPAAMREFNRVLRKGRIAEQLAPAPWLRPLATSMINLPGAGRLVRGVASKIDRRPGRHAAFIARKVKQ